MGQIDKKPGYPIRPTSLVASVCVHGFLIGVIWLLPASRGSTRPIYDEFIRPKEHNITYYNLPKRLPDVTSPKQVGHVKDPRGSEVSKETVIATSANAKSEKQLIWKPAPKLELPKDLPAPDIVIRAASAPFVLPPPPKEPPKQAKVFQPPPRAVPESKPTPQSTLSEPPAIATATLGSRLPMRPGTLVLVTGPLPAPPTLDANGNVDIAVANLNVIDKSLLEIPEGARPGQFSKAPAKGPDASGDVGDSSLKVPDLTIRRDKTATAKAPDAPRAMRTILYSDRVRGIPLTGLSVPLRSSTRSIPAALEARFRGRNVYTIVIPIENLPRYSGDWIIWFAEQESRPGENPLVRAPIPFRKTEPVNDSPGPNQTTRRVQVAATLDKRGKLSSVSVVTAPVPGLAEAVIEDITSWEFKPATRNSAPVDVEIVIEIPFNGTPALVSNTLP